MVLEYETKQAADGAVSGLNGVSLGEIKLSLQCVPQSMAALLLQPSTKIAAPVDESKSPNPLLSLKPTAAIQLSNMVADEDLRDDELYAELVEDVADECNTHGTVRSIVIPRPVEASLVNSEYSSRDKSSGKSSPFVIVNILF